MKLNDQPQLKFASWWRHGFLTVIRTTDILFHQHTHNVIACLPVRQAIRWRRRNLLQSAQPRRLLHPNINVGIRKDMVFVF
ncbi:MAG: hypothetical protein IIB45_11015 [Candidatus Marinimicrobia bacterium]|nr:hypothetical protein [Candidatus Neomarinimicrobiota bacterium]